jgi:hypothetical protein
VQQALLAYRIKDLSIGSGCIIVDGADVIPMLFVSGVILNIDRQLLDRDVILTAQTGGTGAVGVLPPTPGRRLEADNSVGDVSCFGRGVPCSRPIERHSGAA